MGDGVTGSTNAPANQPTNAGRSGDTSQADTAAKAKFGEALNQENLCPPGLTRKPPENCTYLRPPGQPPQPEKPIDIKVHNDPGSSKGPMSPRSDGPDFSKPIPKLPDNSLKPPEGPYHTGGLGSGDGAHIGGWEWKI
jgi:hypothetical protein